MKFLSAQTVYQSIQMTFTTDSQPLAWITGAGGLIGRHLVQTAGELAPQWRIRALSRPQFNLLDFAAVEAEFLRERPQLIIHCAAVSSVAEAKANPVLTQKLNVETTQFLASLATEDAFVFFSTDLVFDGTQGNYREEDPVKPLHLYGETKAVAEQIVVRNPRHLVLRTSINGGVSATGNRSFNEQLRHALRESREMTLFVDEFRSPVPALVTIRALWDLVNKKCAGMYHVAGAEKLSRWQIGQLLIQRWPELHAKINEIKAGSAKDFPGPPRALDTSLDISKVQAVLSVPLPGLSAWLAANPHEPF